MKMGNFIRITAIAAAVCVLGVLYSTRRQPEKIMSKALSAQAATAKPPTDIHQDPPKFALSDSQKAAVDRALELHRPPSTQGEFEYLLLNPSLNRLKLTSEQIRALQDAYDHLREVRLAYEASIAVVTVAGDGSVKITIPPYPDQGANLRRTFQSDLAAREGSETGNAIFAEYGDVLAARNADFGRQFQSYLVTSDTANPGYTKVVLNWSQPDGLSGSTVSQVDRASYYFFGALSAFFPENK
jgi:hypothetical protein